MSRMPLGSAPPRCAAALDHLYSAASCTMPARTGLRSTYASADHRCFGPSMQPKNRFCQRCPERPERALVVLRVPPMNAPRQNAQGIFARWDCDQMDMIAHQTVAQDAYSRIIKVLLHEPQIGEPVLIFRENFTPVHAPLSNVAGYIWQDTPVTPRHGHRLYKKNRSVQAVPFFHLQRRLQAGPRLAA